MFEDKTINDFEKGKLFSTGTKPYSGVSGREGTIYEYSYFGNLGFYYEEEEFLSAFPDLVEEDSDDDPNLTLGLTVREIFEQHKGDNKFLLKNHLMHFPDGFYFCDPCYLEEKEGEDSSDHGQRVFPAGDWEVSIKGNLSPSSSVRYVNSYRNAEKTEMDVVQGFGVDGYRAKGTSCWIVKPGAEFVAISKEPVHSVDVDSGLAGIFSAGKENKFTWDEFLDHLYDYDGKYIEEKEKHAANVTSYGVYSGTTYGDGGYATYELLDASNEVVGYVCSYNGIFSHEDDDDFSVAAEKSKFDYIVQLMHHTYRKDLKFKKTLEYNDYPAIAYGSYLIDESKEEPKSKNIVSTPDESVVTLDNLISDKELTANSLDSMVSGVLSGRLMEVKDIPPLIKPEPLRQHTYRSVRSSTPTPARSTENDLLFYFYRLPNMYYALRVGTIDLEYRKQTEQMYIDQKITKNGKPYVPEWDDNYPDRKLFEAVSDIPVFNSNNIPSMFIGLMSALEAVPEENALFM